MDNANNTASATLNVVKLKDGTVLAADECGVFEVKKTILSVIDEEKWLNYMASQGFALCGRCFFGYRFERNPKASSYYFSVKFSSVSSSDDELCDLTSAEAKERDEEGSKLVCTYCTKVYYKTVVKAEGTDVIVAEDAKNKRRQLKYYFAFAFSLMCFWLGLLCYNLMYLVRFEAAGATVTFKDGQLHDYIVKEFSIWDIALDMSKWFGEFPCTPHISVFLCLTVLTLPFAVYYFDQYMYARAFEKLTKK